MFHDPPHLQLRLNLRRELRFLMSLILSLFAPIYGAERSMPLLRTATLTPNLSVSRGSVVAGRIFSSEATIPFEPKVRLALFSAKFSVGVHELEHDERCLLDATQKPLVSTGFLRPPRDFSLVSADGGGQPLPPDSTLLRDGTCTQLHCCIGTLLKMGISRWRAGQFQTRFGRRRIADWMIEHLVQSLLNFVYNRSAR
jgi:hypothetical protein